MAIQRAITLPALTPSAWELRLPDYPVITSRWRGSDFPELLGSLPSGARWSLSFDSMTSAEALALLLPWRATAGGQWALSLLPGALAGGVDNADFRKRLTGTTWSIASEPRKEPVKNGRFNVTIELVHELDFNSLYGPLSQFLSLPTDDVLALQFAGSLAVAALPTQFYRPPKPISNQPVVSLGLVDGLAVVGTGAAKVAKELNAQAALGLSVQDSLAVAALPTSFHETIEQFTAQALASLNIADDLDVVESSALFAKTIATRASQESINLNASEGLAVGGTRVSLFKRIPETTAEELLLSGITLDSIGLNVADSLQVAAINPVKIKRADLTLALDISEDLDAIAEPIELFAASRVRLADALALLNESSNLSVAALPTQLFRGGRIKSAGATLSLSVARGLDPVALPTSFSPKPIKQFTAQSALNLDIVLGVDAIALPASFDKQDTAQFTAQLALDLNASRELSVAAVGLTKKQPDLAVLVLLHMDGSNGSTVFTDSSTNGLTVTASGNAQISTAQSKFGGASLYLDGSGDFVTIGSTPLLAFTGEFSIQGWVRLDNVSASYKTFCEIGTYTNGVLIRPVSAGTDCVYVNGTLLGDIKSYFTANSWHYISVTRNSSSLVEVAIDGTVRLSQSVSGVVNSSGGGLRIGEALHTSSQALAGYVDDFRITNTVQSHAVPTAPFPDP